MKIWMNVADAAAYAGLSKDSIYTAVERKELRHVRVGGRRSIRLKAEWIDEWFARNTLGVIAAQNIEQNQPSIRPRS